MVKSNLVFFTFLTLFIFAHGNLISDNLNKIMKEIKNGILNKTIDLGNNTGRISEINLSTDGCNYIVNGIKNWGFDLEMNATTILITGTYEFKNFTITTSNFSLPLRGKGNFSIAFEDNYNRVKGEIKPDFVTVITNLSNLTLSMNTSKVKIENLFYDPELSEYLSILISNVLPRFLKIISDEKDKVTQLLNKVVWCIMNKPSDIEKCLKEKLFFDENEYLKLNDFAETLKNKLKF